MKLYCFTLKIEYRAILGKIELFYGLLSDYPGKISAACQAQPACLRSCQLRSGQQRVRLSRRVCDRVSCGQVSSVSGSAGVSWYSIRSDISHCNNLQIISKLLSEIYSLCLKFCNVLSPRIFSFLIRFVLYPLFFNTDSISTLYTITNKSPLYHIFAVHNAKIKIFENR